MRGRYLWCGPRQIRPSVARAATRAGTKRTGVGRRLCALRAGSGLFGSGRCAAHATGVGDHDAERRSLAIGLAKQQGEVAAAGGPVGLEPHQLATDTAAYQQFARATAAGIARRTVGLVVMIGVDAEQPAVSQWLVDAQCAPSVLGQNSVRLPLVTAVERACRNAAMKSTCAAWMASRVSNLCSDGVAMPINTPTIASTMICSIRVTPCCPCGLVRWRSVRMTPFLRGRSADARLRAKCPQWL